MTTGHVMVKHAGMKNSSKQVHKQSGYKIRPYATKLKMIMLLLKKKKTNKQYGIHLREGTIEYPERSK